MTYAYNPGPGKWTAGQQMSVMGKREEISREDLEVMGGQCRIATRPKIRAVIDEVAAALEGWERFAAEAGVREEAQVKIGKQIGAQLG